MHNENITDPSGISKISQTENELLIIKKIVQDSRNAVADKGWHYIYWGVIVTIALLINYWMVISNISMNYQGMLWFISMISASLIEMIIVKRTEKDIKEKTFSGRLLSTLWGTSGVCMFMFGFIGTLSGAYNPIYIFPVLSAVLGAVYYISGTIQQISWLKYITFGWWTGSLLMFIFPGVNSIIIFAAMIVFFQIIPGLILHRKWKASILNY
ncbi:MAG TPA: hypothetical protein PK753_14105 [Ignavibacteria bacterium]|nr:hypothetical protein [Ignavibacteria bacterium]